MQETPTYTPQQSLTQTPPPQASPAQRKTTAKLPTIIAAVLLVAIIIAGGLYWRSHKLSSSPKASRPLLTLYYSNGKTILWKSSESVTGSTAPAFISYLQSQLRTDYGSNFMNRGSWNVTTTLSKPLQNAAEQAIQSQKTTLTSQGVGTAIFIGEDVTNGQIESWVDSHINKNDTDNPQQLTSVGSLQLPFTYAAYLANTPDSSTNSIFDDAQMPLTGWPCTDKTRPTGSNEANCLWDPDYTYAGSMPLSQALALGRNVPAVEAAMAMNGNSTDSTSTAGINKVVSLANNMGSDGACYQFGSTSFTRQTQTQCSYPAAIGDGLMASPQRTLQAYATLANSGSKLSQSVILKTTLNDKIIYRWTQPKAVSVLSSNTSQALTGVLSDPNSSWLQADNMLFATKSGAKTAIEYSGPSAYATGDVQFTSKYAAEFWIEGQTIVDTTNATDESMQGTLTGSIDALTIPVTYDWMNTAE